MVLNFFQTAPLQNNKHRKSHNKKPPKTKLQYKVFCISPVSEITAPTNTAYQCTIIILLCNKKHGPSNAHVLFAKRAPLAKRYPIRASSETHTKKSASPQHRCRPPPVPTIVSCTRTIGLSLRDDRDSTCMPRDPSNHKRMEMIAIGLSNGVRFNERHATHSASEGEDH